MMHILRHNFFSFLFRSATVCLFVAWLLPSVSVAATKITVYTSIEPELLHRYAKAFTAQHPDIQIAWVRDSAGPIGARLLAEKNAPKADVIFGVALSSVLPLSGYGLLEAYRPEGVDELALGMVDATDPPLWIAINSWGTSICINTRELAKKGLAEPTSWEDLTKPEYKGMIAAGSPLSSSTMYMNVSAWVHSMGEKNAWDFMEKLNGNIAMYTHSGCKPAQMAAQGEIPIGIASPACAHPYVLRKAPLKILIPQEGTGWDMEVSALVKNGKNSEAAKKLLDFCTSKEVAAIAAENLYVPARKDSLDAGAERTRAAFIRADPVQSAAMRKQLLEEWRKRFENR